MLSIFSEINNSLEFMIIQMKTIR